MITLHFEIKPNGRIIIDLREGDTKLNFGRGYRKGRGRRASTLRGVGEAFIKIADKARELGYED